METKSYANQQFPSQAAKPFQSPRFNVDDPQGYVYLEENGYAVFKNVANEAQIELGKSLVWDYLESLGVGISRHDEKTWDTPDWPDPFGKGIVASEGVGHCELLWMVRGIPNVKKIFSMIWKTNDLISSFDGFCIHRPFEYNQKWKTRSHWYHLDQNGWYKPSKLCVQGFLNFYPAGPDDGGLLVVPKSHTIFNSIFKDRPALKKCSDWITLHNDKKLWTHDLPSSGLSPIKVCCEPGDFVLWDSRTIHANCGANTARPYPKIGLLSPRRLVTYVCMTPTSRLTEDLRKKRIQCFEMGMTTTHWPEESNVPGSRQNREGYQFTPPNLSPEQKQLIPLNN